LRIPFFPFRKQRNTLVLGGGGAKSFSQIGVLQLLEKEQIPIHTVIGSSMGAVIGALYCMGRNSQEIEESILGFSQLPEVKKVERSFHREKKRGIKKAENIIKDIQLYLSEILREGIWEEEDLSRGLSILIPSHLTFSDLSIPFACVAVEMVEGKRLLIKDGNLLEAVVASAAIPGIFAPLKRGEKILADGGVLSKNPVLAGEILGSDFIISILPGDSLSEFSPRKALDLFLRMNEIRDWELTRVESSLADFLFIPPVEKWKWHSFSCAREIIKTGKEEGKSKINSLREALRKGSRKKKLRKIILPYFPYD